MQAPINSAGGPNIDRPASAPNASSSEHIGELTRPSFAKTTLSSQSVPSVQEPSRAKAMQLGSGRVPVTDTIVSDLLAETTSPSVMEANPWGSDLMDVNADADDWSTLNLS